MYIPNIRFHAQVYVHSKYGFYLHMNVYVCVNNLIWVHVHLQMHAKCVCVISKSTNATLLYLRQTCTRNALHVRSSIHN